MKILITDTETMFQNLNSIPTSDMHYLKVNRVIILQKSSAPIMEVIIKRLLGYLAWHNPIIILLKNQNIPILV